MTETLPSTDPVPQSDSDWLELVTALAEQAQSFLLGLLRPWSLYQVGILVSVLIAAYLLNALMAPKMHAWMRTREGIPMWRMRLLVTVHKRLKLIFFVILISLIVYVMRQVTWPSRSYLLGVVAELSFGWLAIILVTRLIQNPLLRNWVRYIGWVWVTLVVTNFQTEFRDLLDSVALSLGDFRISLWLIGQATFSLGLLFFGARFLTGAAERNIKKNTAISPSIQVLAIKFIQVVLYAAAFFIGLKSIGFDLTGLAVLSGAIGVGLGFGLQKVVSNLVSGVIILLDKSIKPGDVISIGDTFGWIEALGARYVSVVTRDGKEYLIPNEDLITGQVVNWSHSNDYVRIDIHFGLSYDDNPHAVRKTAVETAYSVDRVLKDKPAVCHITGFGDSSVDYILRFWIKDPTGGLTNIRGNVYLALWDAFHAQGFTMPFPQREVRLLGEPSAPKAALD